MRLEDISVGMLRKALDGYVSLAYEHSPLPVTVKARVSFIREYPGETLSGLLGHEVVERIPCESEQKDVQCYGIRLGNEKYPHMKLMLHQAAEDDWRFTVDCHDGAFEVESASPDRPRAEELKAYNHALRESIEALWREADLPVVDET